jgi:hypothetical protein
MLISGRKCGNGVRSKSRTFESPSDCYYVIACPHSTKYTTFHHVTSRAIVICQVLASSCIHCTLPCHPALIPEFLIPRTQERVFASRIYFRLHAPKEAQHRGPNPALARDKLLDTLKLVDYSARICNWSLCYITVSYCSQSIRYGAQLLMSSLHHHV